MIYSQFGRSTENTVLLRNIAGLHSPKPPPSRRNPPLWVIFLLMSAGLITFSYGGGGGDVIKLYCNFRGRVRGEWACLRAGLSLFLPDRRRRRSFSDTRTCAHCGGESGSGTPRRNMSALSRTERRANQRRSEASALNRSAA